MEFEVWPTVNFMHYLSQIRFLSFSMANEIIIDPLKRRLDSIFVTYILTLSNSVSCILHNTQGIVLKFSHMM